MNRSGQVSWNLILSSFSLLVFLVSCSLQITFLLLSHSMSFMSWQQYSTKLLNCYSNNLNTWSKSLYVYLFYFLIVGGAPCDHGQLGRHGGANQHGNNSPSHFHNQQFTFPTNHQVSMSLLWPSCAFHIENKKKKQQGFCYVFGIENSFPLLMYSYN